MHGVSLEAVLRARRDGTLRLPRGTTWEDLVCELVIGTAEALAFLHSHSVTHRDLKPAVRGSALHAPPCFPVLASTNHLLPLIAHAERAGGSRFPGSSAVRPGLRQAHSGPGQHSQQQLGHFPLLPGP